MELAEMAEHRLRSELDHARASRMVPAGRPRLDLQPVDRRATGFESRDGIGLGVEHADVTSIACPVAAGTVELRRAAPDTRRDAALFLRRVALIGARHLEQRDV